MMLREKPDVILLDMAMPEMDGLHVLQEMRKIPNLKSSPVIIITANGQEEFVKQSIGLGVVSYLLKPVNSSEVAERICEVVSKIESDEIKIN